MNAEKPHIPILCCRHPDLGERIHPPPEALWPNNLSGLKSSYSSGEPRVLMVHPWARSLSSIQAPGCIRNALRYLKHLREAGRYDKGLQARPLPFCKSSWRPGRIS